MSKPKIFRHDNDGTFWAVIFEDIVFFYYPKEDRLISRYDALAIASNCGSLHEAIKKLLIVDFYTEKGDSYWTLRGSVMMDLCATEARMAYADSYSGLKTYLMTDSNTGYTKIGKSKNPGKREKTLQSEKPTITLKLVCDQMVEGKLHKEYAEKRIRGEWFDLTESDIEQIISEYGFYKP